MTLVVRTFPTGPLQANCYVAYNANSKRALVIDPGDKCPAVLECIKKEGLQVDQIVLTHAHFDHVFGVGYLQAELEKLGTRPKSYVHQSDKEHWAANRMFATFFGLTVPPDYPGEPDVLYTEVDMFDLGDELVFKVLHTPGHTPGSSVIYTLKGEAAFTGDTIFSNSVGRTDFPGGSHAQLCKSIDKIYATLPRSMTIYPGHNEEEQLGAAERAIRACL
ncbi:Hydroxyacylglutathione hydrolase [Giardia muris]|uniref:Hydroxyacylglutathione hydrolase n=1 Tax=Giardia muris TaxID=5742 RepID=A0A4Z1SMS6_GIAMU|nr:Hydroxyacylglutathione hydrolase [Giardia muris]|eukprot:TNJ27014.1 Hydroxyacylglutathione hydrolase [Giardia muris]